MNGLFLMNLPFVGKNTARKVRKKEKKYEEMKKRNKSKNKMDKENEAAGSDVN